MKDATIQIVQDYLRKEIAHLTEDRIELGKLLGSEAARCFPEEHGSHWDGAFFYLNPNTAQLCAFVEEYPQMFYPTYSRTINLSAAEFHDILKISELQPPSSWSAKNDYKWKEYLAALRKMKSGQDWKLVLDDLSGALANAREAQRIREEEKAKKRS